MSTWPILSLLVFLPVAGIAFLALTGRGGADNDRNARDVTLWTSLANLALAIVLAVRFNPDKDGFQFVEHAAWLPELGVAYHVGVDGISVLFILLTTLLVPICIVASWTTVVERVRSWMVAFLAMEALMIGVFVARDALLFYVFFEAILIPMFLIIGIWGGERRVHAAFKFVLYTLAGSVLFLIAILTLASLAGSTDMDLLEHTPIAIDAQRWIWIAMFASFAVKVPMLAAAHLAARRPRPGADRRVGHPGGRPPEARRLWGFSAFRCRCCPPPARNSCRWSTSSAPSRSSTRRWSR